MDPDDDAADTWSIQTWKGEVAVKKYNYVLLLIAMTGFLVQPAQAQVCFALTEYFPLESGNVWDFRITPGGASQRLTVLPGSTFIGGVATKAVQTSDGITTYQTNDANGLRLYRRTATIEGIAVTVTYNPRIVRGTSTVCLGDSESETGKATLSAPGLGSATVDYTSQSFIEAVETVGVPAGTFQALRMRWVTRVFGTIDGESFDETVTEINWLARLVGPVRQQVSDGNITAFAELTSTNVIPPQSNLGLSMVDLADPVSTGSTLQYRLNVTNSGPNHATGVRLTNTLPPGVGPVTTSGSGWICTTSGSTLTCTLPSISLGGVAILNVSMAAPSAAGTVVNTASVSSDAIDPDTSNNSASESTLIIADVDNDSILDENDNCPTVANVDQVNTDGDDRGNACDDDDDNDGTSDSDELAVGRNPLVNEPAVISGILNILLDD